MRVLFAFLLIATAVFAATAQTDCPGDQLFSESKCAGDEQSAAEKELFRIINEYRASNGLSEVTWSDSLAVVANRRLLDLTRNIKSLTHSWSNCPYNIDDEKTWPCVTDSPRRFKTGYEGDGHENVFLRIGAAATPADALDAWKKSPMHNNLILNLENWKDVEFEGLGVAISGQYAAIWFGSAPDENVALDAIEKGLGVTYARVIYGLTPRISMRRESSVGETQKWTGKSADNQIRLELYGREKDISETNMALVVRVGKGVKLSAAARLSVQQFLKNLSPSWPGRDTWFEASLKQLATDGTAEPSTTRDGKSIRLRLDSDGSLRISVVPAQRPQPKEL